MFLDSNDMHPKISSFRKPEEYRLSFSTGGLYVIESVHLIETYFSLTDWDDVIEHSIEQNLLQFKSSQSTRRAVREICTRLKSMSWQELEFFQIADTFDRPLLCWIACCRTYQFIGDFATQVLVENFASYKLELRHADFDFYFEEQAQYHPELEELTEGTRKKLRQILFRMMREAGILSNEDRIIAGITSQSLQDINKQGKRDLSLFVTGVT